MGMNKQIRISANYWNSLSLSERLFIQENAIDHGIQYCKRIVTLARSLGDWDTIVNASHYVSNEAEKVILSNVWIIFRGGQHIGIIQKTMNIGLSERIHSWDGNSMRESWNNLCSKNPPKNVLKYEVLSINPSEEYTGALNLLYSK